MTCVRVANISTQVDVLGEDLTDNEVYPNISNICCIHYNLLLRELYLVIKMKTSLSVLYVIIII